MSAISILAGVETRYFSLARHALASGLLAAKIGPGKTVLLPEFICRDLLPAIHTVGANVAYYPVGPDLTPSLPDLNWPVSSAVLAVNYFGFPQDLSVFRAYSQRTGALLIEDNAHGFLSRDAAGVWLGLRAPVGLFSMRKTFAIPDGAALSAVGGPVSAALPPQAPFTGSGLAKAQTIKGRLRSVPVIGALLLHLAKAGVRSMRLLCTGQPLPVCADESESSIDAASEPWSGLQAALAAVDVDVESERRRLLYVEFERVATEHGVRPLFHELPVGCVPYGFAFRRCSVEYVAIERLAARYGFDVTSWPDLPSEVVPIAPVHYQDVRVVKFLI